MSRGAAGGPPRVLFLGVTYAGHETRFLNLEAHTRADPRIRPRYRRVTGWQPGGLLERVPGLPRPVKGRLRAVATAAAVARLPRPDVIWTSGGVALVPHLWSQLGPLRRPLVLDLDWTLEQQEALAPAYYARAAKRGARLALARAQERALWRATSTFSPWSTWAAESLAAQGVPRERIRVLPPGVDLDAWRQRPELRDTSEGPLRLLFVGGNFARKGGDLLLELVRERFAARCELDIVTREPVAPTPGVRVHRATPNSPALRELYARADLFVMPTRAECFGIATVEAMASGLPVVVGNVGGAGDIVDEGSTGWLIDPTAEALAQALERALAQRAELPAFGERARRVAEQRFDARRNATRTVDLIVELAERARADG